MSTNRVTCDLCPRKCRLKENQTGFCHVRKNIHGEIVLTDYGKITSLQIDPIEKKPLYHYKPGQKVLSLGMRGCNLACRFCQNHSISHPNKGEMQAISSFYQKTLEPENIVSLTKKEEIPMIAFTYNEPIIAMEYVTDTFMLSRENGIKNIIVSNGYISPKHYDHFFKNVDAVNIDLKFFENALYRKYTSASLEPVLETLRYINSKKIHLEITTLIIDGINDSNDIIEKESKWIIDNLGQNTPLHLSAFHSAYKMNHYPTTHPQTLLRLQEIAKRIGLVNVYTGNIASLNHTHCSKCGNLFIERNGYDIKVNEKIKKNNICPSCGAQISDIQF